MFAEVNPTMGNTNGLHSDRAVTGLLHPGTSGGAGRLPNLLSTSTANANLSDSIQTNFVQADNYDPPGYDAAVLSDAYRGFARNLCLRIQIAR
jgi:hypothetical protein